MFQTKKSDLIDCLESSAPQPDDIPDVDVSIVHVAALASIQKEAETSLLFHASHASFKPFKKQMIHTTYTHVMIIVIAMHVQCISYGCEI